MKRIPQVLLARMAAAIPAADRDEMAIPSYLHPNPAMRWMAWRRLEVVAGFLQRFAAGSARARGRTLMDFGCGTGVLFDEARRHADRIYGVDIVLEPAAMLVEEWGLDNVSLLDPEAARREIPENGVDTIVAAEVLEHIEPLDDTLAFFRSRLASHGCLIVSVPTENRLYRLGRRLAGFEGHYHQNNAAAIHAQVLTAGFRQIRVQKIPAPGPLAVFWVIAYRPR